MKTIAIIEDDVHIGNLMEEAMGQEQYQVLRACSGTEALYLLEKNHPDLIVLDLMLPGISGEELPGKLEGIPVIVVSAKVGIDDMVKLLMKHSTQVVTKSVLLDSISWDTPDCTESSLKMHVSNLRKKLRAADGWDYIEAVWGIGFKLRIDD